MNEINQVLRSYCFWGEDVEKIFDFDYIPHFCIPSLNGSFEKDEVFKYVDRFVENYDKLPYSISSSLPFGESALLYSEHLNGFDPAMVLVNDKKKWESCKNKIIFANLKCKQQVFKKRKKSVRTVSPGIIQLAKHLNCDPDPNFSVCRGYNWYYSGGNLNSISINNNYFLLSTRNSTPGVLQVTPLTVSEADCVPLDNKKNYLHLYNKQGIFQTVVKKKFVAVRQKNFATLFAVHNDNEKNLKFKKVHASCESDDSIVSLSISNLINGEYCTLTTSHTLKIWSSERKDCKFSHKFEDRYCKKSCDHWGYINYFSKNCFIISTRDSISLKDKRTNLNVDLKCWPPKSPSNCNYISLIMTSNINDNIAYVGTKHNLLELDVRQSYSKEWVHMMEYAPMYGATCPVDGNEVLFTGSQNLNEVCLIESNNRSLPFLLPSPNEMVVNARMRGVCLDSMVATRCNFSASGLTCVPYGSRNAKGFYVFRSTSVGDIFYQKVVSQKNDSGTQNNECYVSVDVDKNDLLTWERRCQKAVENITVKPLKVTDVVNKRDTFLSLLGNKEKKNVSNFIKRKYDEKNKSCHGKWNISKKRLMEFDDPLGQSLLDVWEIEDDDEWDKRNNNSEEFIAEEKTDANSKIDSWFSQLPDHNTGVSVPTTSKILSTVNPNPELPLNKLASSSCSIPVPFIQNLTDHNDFFNLDEDTVDCNKIVTDVKRTTGNVFPNVVTSTKKLNNITVNSKFSGGF